MASPCGTSNTSSSRASFSIARSCSSPRKRYWRTTVSAMRCRTTSLRRGKVGSIAPTTLQPYRDRYDVSPIVTPRCKGRAPSSMDRKAFDTLVARLEPAARRPWAYRARVALLVLGGYAYLVGLLVVLVALAVAALWSARSASAAAVRLAIAPVALSYAVGRAVCI